MNALISTVEVEQPFKFLEVSEFAFQVNEPFYFWVNCPEGVTPLTHKWDGTQFVEIPPPPALQPTNRIVNN